ncbi:MAG: tRNA (adenosine(37)-N6)-threonylcarbamoyltransferase complex dimerization subunit type 1 TsaB [Pseudomonadota bacterium]
MPEAILSFDTSAAHCAVGLLWDGAIVFGETRPMTKGQAETLFGMIDQAIGDRPKTHLQKIAVGIGPGNFTGTRIAVSAARGLALSLGIPAIGISNFDLLYAPEDVPKGHHTRALPAPKDQIYVQNYDGPTALGPPHLEAGAETQHPVDVPKRLIAYAKLRSFQQRPAPLYVRPADAALPSEAPITLLP